MSLHGGPVQVRKNGIFCELLEERRLLSFSPFSFPQTSVNNQANFDFPTMAAGPDGNIWVADPTGERLLRVKPDGGMTQFNLAKNAEPAAISGGPDGYIWYVDDLLNTVNRVTPAGKITSFDIKPLGRI